MAKQKSLLKLQGTIGGISFYKSKDGYLAREKGGVDAERIAKDPGFARTRENGAEFGTSASAGKLLRDAVRVLAKDASDARVTSRVTQIMAQIKNMDEANARGERSVAEGIVKEEAKALLRDFNFNVDSVLSGVIFSKYVVDLEAGSISFEMLNPAKEINIPSGASHVVLKNAVASINFETGESEIFVSDPVRIAVGAAAQSVLLKPAKLPTLEGVTLMLFSVDFVQSMNNVDYSLNNNGYNALAIVEIE